MSRWVAGFVGDINMIEGRIVLHAGDRIMVAVPDIGTIAAVPVSRPSSADISVAIRPEKIRLETFGAVAGDAEAGNGGFNRFAGDVIDVNYLGGMSVCRVKLEGGFVLRASVTNASRRTTEAILAGQRVTVSFAAADCVVLEQ